MTTKCAIEGCTRKAGTFRIIKYDTIVSVCSRHAAIIKHNREEAARR